MVIFKKKLLYCKTIAFVVFFLRIPFIDISFNSNITEKKMSFLYIMIIFQKCFYLSTNIISHKCDRR